jgi:hypothetical protein
VSLDETQLVLFQDLAGFSGYRLDWTDPENPVVTVGPCKLPVSKDVMTVDGISDPIQLPGLTVYAPETGRVYVSLPAIAMIDVFGSNNGFGPPPRNAIKKRLRELAREVGVDPNFAVSLLN